MMRTVVVGACLALAAGCGGRIEAQLDAAAGGDSATGGDSLSPGDSVAPADTSASGDSAAEDAGESGVDASPCALTNGVMLCGEVCGNCSSGRCDHFLSAQQTPENLGVCSLGQVVPTEPPNVARCEICPAGYPLCVDVPFRIPFCVLEDVCVKAFNIGMRDACTYEDHTLWSPSDQIPTEAACPIVGGSLCGGGCGDCAAGLQCAGRSPTHPFGICATRYRSDGSDASCDSATQCRAGEACFHWVVSPPNDVYGASISGFCVPAGVCDAVKGVLGATCS